MGRMRERRVLFSDAVWRLVKREAEAEQISANQFVREASIFYAGWLIARREGSELEATRMLIEDLRDD